MVTPQYSFRQNTFFPAKSPVSKQGFTLIELLVVIAIISLLVSILLPSLTKAKDLARQVQCFSNLRNLGTAMGCYINDNDGTYNNMRDAAVGGEDDYLNKALHPYIPWCKSDDRSWVPTEAWVCPTSLAFPDEGLKSGRPYGQSLGFRMGTVSGGLWDSPPGVSTWYGFPSVRAGDIRNASEKLLVADATGWAQWDSSHNYSWDWGAYRTDVGHVSWYNSKVATPLPGYRHEDKACAVMVDGHCESFDYGRLYDERSIWLPRE